jgi:hypothetical protein
LQIGYDFLDSSNWFGSMETAVIRFKCPHCGRFYEVSPVLRHLPLLCKGCGNRIEVPESSQESESVSATLPESEPLATKASGNAMATVPTPDVRAPKKESKPSLHPEGESFAVAETHTAIPPETPAQNTPALETTPPQDHNPDRSKPRMRPLPIVLDVFVVLFLFVLGGFLGEFLAGKSTGDVWREAGSAAKFPPIGLLLWLAPPTMLSLVYYLLASRRKGLGVWLQRRTER